MPPKKKTSFPCLTCKEEVGGKTGGAQCEYCERWSHPKCGNISHALIKIMHEQPGVVSWYCEACTTVSKKVKKELHNLNLKHEEVLKEVGLNKEKLAVHDTVLKDHQKQLDGLNRDAIIQDSSELMMRELQEQNARKNNLVIHQIPEPPATMSRGGDKRDYDICKVLEILEFLDCRIDKECIKFIYRPGERTDMDRPRPVILNLRDPGARQYILANTRLLANSKYDKISIIPDLTPNQRKCEDKLRKEADRLNRNMDKDEQLNWEWVLVGERGQRRLIKRKNFNHTGQEVGPSRRDQGRPPVRPSTWRPGVEDRGRSAVRSPPKETRDNIPREQSLRDRRLPPQGVERPRSLDSEEMRGAILMDSTEEESTEHPQEDMDEDCLGDGQEIQPEKEKVRSSSKRNRDNSRSPSLPNSKKKTT